MQMDDGTFLKWATGTIVSLFATIFGSYKFTQGQIDKHKDAIDKTIDEHKKEIHADLNMFDCVQTKDCKEDRDHLADHMKRMAKTHSNTSRAIFKELKSLNDKLFEVVKDK
ncbi:hypothetical protein KAR91_64490 [Candidatus Pacearchaeota archaeon]|nr:hypothetical protein [Candidatus Pacearchaeota archaeon]